MSRHSASDTISTHGEIGYHDGGPDSRPRTSGANCGYNVAHVDGYFARIARFSSGGRSRKDTSTATYGAKFCNADDRTECCELAPGRYGNGDQGDCGGHMNSLLTSTPCPGNDQISYIEIPGSCSVKLFMHSGHPRERPADGSEVWVLKGPGEFRASQGHFGDNTISDATIDCTDAPFTSDACVCSNGASGGACGSSERQYNQHSILSGDPWKQSFLNGMSAEDPTSCPDQQANDAADGWLRVFAIYDDRGKDDLPNSAAEIGAGFARENAFYIGNDALNELDILEAEVCAGACGQAMACRPIDASLIHSHVRESAPGMLNTDVKKMIGCFTGQCERGEGSCNLMAQGSYTDCTLFNGQGWSDSHACGCVSLYSDTDWHVDGSGLSMKRASTGAEFGRWNAYQGDVNAFVIRLKASSIHFPLPMSRVPMSSYWAVDDVAFQDSTSNAVAHASILLGSGPQTPFMPSVQEQIELEGGAESEESTAALRTRYAECACGCHRDNHFGPTVDRAFCTNGYSLARLRKLENGFSDAIEYRECCRKRVLPLLSGDSNDSFMLPPDPGNVRFLEARFDARDGKSAPTKVQVTQQAGGAHAANFVVFQARRRASSKGQWPFPDSAAAGDQSSVPSSEWVELGRAYNTGGVRTISIEAEPCSGMAAVRHWRLSKDGAIVSNGDDDVDTQASSSSSSSGGGGSNQCGIVARPRGALLQKLSKEAAGQRRQVGDPYAPEFLGQSDICGEEMILYQGETCDDVERRRRFWLVDRILLLLFCIPLLVITWIACCVDCYWRPAIAALPEAEIARPAGPTHATNFPIGESEL